MDKNIGLRRNSRCARLDAAATARVHHDDPNEVRAELDLVVAADIASAVNRRKAIDILINIWCKTSDLAPKLWQPALARFPTASASDRLWLHYGLTLLYNPFFRDTVATIGQTVRFGDPVTPGLVKQRLVATRSQLGSLDKAAERVVFSLRNWGLLVEANRRSTYLPIQPALPTKDQALEGWLLACVLRAHSAREIPFADLIRLPEIFPFHISIGLIQLRHHADLDFQRQSSGWDMVRPRR